MIEVDAWPMISTTVDGVEEVFKQGTRLRADHPAVTAHPELCEKDGDPEEFNVKRRRLNANVYANSGTDTRAVRILNTKYRAKRAVKLDVDGESRTVKEVTCSRTTILLAQVAPDAFELIQVPM